uniref:Purinergic receptor n=1 Tax=Bicosoecida sp. CB-2014 TaxID=1486930 RepID=A0A7S1GFI7_9STRA|mmetsp:Transcript_7957/g.28369  ORF Transcript_7957/g.28369 Transcript_7957/m.28369 type:complete len:440 (+) Transcript_7957:194-1513(+)
MGCASLRKYVSYSTIKMAVIEDVVLGTVHYLCMLGVAAYIVLSLLGYSSYVKDDAPIGSVRLQMHPPTVIGKHGHGCNPDVFGCNFNFTSPDTLGYCTQSGAAGKGATRPLQCALWDDNEVVQPVIEGSPFYMATRVTESNETLLCDDPKSGACAHTYGIACNASFTYKPDCTVPAQRSFFVADVESFTLLVDHSVRAPKIPSIHASAFQMHGKLTSCTGTDIIPASTTEGQDVFTLGELLSTIQMKDGRCGVSLDDASTVTGSKNSIRYDGAILVLNIEYTNIKPWSGVQPDITYEYKLDVLHGTKSKVEQQIFKQYPQQRVIRDQHGLKLVVIQTGRLGIFDVQTLLVQLTTTLTLFAAATTLVDLLALYVLPHRAAYRDAKVEEVLVRSKRRVVLANPLKWRPPSSRPDDGPSVRAGSLSLPGHGAGTGAYADDDV